MQHGNRHTVWENKRALQLSLWPSFKGMFQNDEQASFLAGNYINTLIVFILLHGRDYEDIL